MEDGRPEHLLAYVRTSKVTDWKRLALRYGDLGRPVFIYRSDDDRVFAHHARERAVLWIIESHEGAPPSLVARLAVAGRVHAKLTRQVRIVAASGRVEIPDGMLRRFEYGGRQRWYAVGDPRRSRFFGCNDASRALMRTELEGKATPWRDAQGWLPKFGQSLQRPRLIASGWEALDEYARTLSQRSVFLSWKHRDFKGRHKRIQAIVSALAAEGIDCWWDQRALPASRALKKLWDEPELLTRLLNYGLAKSKLLLALGSENWGEPSTTDAARNWTLGEWRRSEMRFGYELDGRPRRGWPRGLAHRVFHKGTPMATVLRKVADYLASTTC